MPDPSCLPTGTVLYDKEYKCIYKIIIIHTHSSILFERANDICKYTVQDCPEASRHDNEVLLLGPE